MEKRLLVVDDEEILLESIKSYFERRDYLVYIASKGEVALELLKQHNPNIILLDLHLEEGITSKETLQEALKINPQLIVAIWTGFGYDVETEQSCKELGARLLLEKPLPLSELKIHLDNLLIPQS